MTLEDFLVVYGDWKNLGIHNFALKDILADNGKDPVLRLKHFAHSAPGALDKELKIVVLDEKFADVFSHNSLIKIPVLLLVSFDEESP